MAGSADYQKQLEDMGQMPDFKSQIAAAYDKPVLKPIVGEAGKLESQWLPTIFNTFAQQGTGAADMSPAAKLAMIGQNLGRLGGQISSNNSIQNFYGAQIQDLANLEAQKYQNRQQQLKDLYSMSFQREEAQRQERARQAALAAQRASSTNAINDLLNKYKQGGAMSGGQPSISVNGQAGGANPKALSDQLVGTIADAYAGKDSPVLTNLLNKLPSQMFGYSSPKQISTYANQVLGTLALPVAGLGQMTGWY